MKNNHIFYTDTCLSHLVVLGPVLHGCSAPLLIPDSSRAVRTHSAATKALEPSAIRTNWVDVEISRRELGRSTTENLNGKVHPRYPVLKNTIEMWFVYFGKCV